MADKLISQLEEGIPTSSDFILFDPSGSGYYKKAQAGNLPGGGGGGGLVTLATPTLSVSVISSSQINLSWTNVSNESSYKLEWSANGTSGWTQIGGTIAANTTAYNHTGLTDSTVYYYRISAIGDGGTYATSGFGTANATTSASGSTQLSTPGSFAATVIGANQINLSWTDVSNESSYMLEWSPNGSSGWTQIGGSIAAGSTSYNHTGLTAATLYYYRLKAVGNGTTFTDSNYATDNDTTSAGVSYLTWTLEGSSLMETYNSAKGIRSQAGSADQWNLKQAISVQSFTAGETVIAIIDKVGDDIICLGWDASSSKANNNATPDWDGLLQFYANGANVYDGTTFATQAWADGQWWKLVYSGSTIVASYSDDAGLNWTPFTTWTSVTGTKYIYARTFRSALAGFEEVYKS